MMTAAPRSAAWSIAKSVAFPHACRPIATSNFPAYASIIPTVGSTFASPAARTLSPSLATAPRPMSSATKRKRGKRWARARTRLPEPAPKSTTVGAAGPEPASSESSRPAMTPTCAIFLSARAPESPPPRAGWHAAGIRSQSMCIPTIPHAARGRTSSAPARSTWRIAAPAAASTSVALREALRARWRLLCSRRRCLSSSASCPDVSGARGAPSPPSRSARPERARSEKNGRGADRVST